MKKVSRLFTLLTSLAIISSVMASCTNKKEKNDMPTDSTQTTTENITTKLEETTAPQPDIDPVIKAEVEELLDSKHKLVFNDDGSFRVLIMADLHIPAGANETILEKVQARIKLLVDRENPNLVIFTGDNTIRADSEEKLRACISAFVGYIEEKKIPWCHVYGNHDFESALPTSQQQEIYESFEYCISKDVDTNNLSGVGNYVNGIYNKDGSLGAVIYCLDSGAYDSIRGGYDYIKKDQINWYKETSEKLQTYNGGNVVPALMAFHIPLVENNVAYLLKDNKEVVFEYDGDRNENICASATDTTLFETALSRGDVKAIVTGHDHVNTYMYNYKGIKLCSSPNFSEFEYNNPEFYGSRVFDMNLSTIDNMPTYVSYINQKTSNIEAYDKDTSLEYTEDSIENAIISGFNSAALSGTATVTTSSDHGVNNSESLKIERSETSNFEFSFEITNKGKAGALKYLIVWADFSNVEFRKACFGLISDYQSVFRTDDTDTPTPLYYLADGSTEWQTLSHGNDGCFGTGDPGSQAMKGKKGYFAAPLEYISKLGTGKYISADSEVFGFYFYGSLESGEYANIPFYIDSIMLVEDYTSFSK